MLCRALDVGTGNGRVDRFPLASLQVTGPTLHVRHSRAQAASEDRLARRVDSIAALLPSMVGFDALGEDQRRLLQVSHRSADRHPHDELDVAGWARTLIEQSAKALHGLAT